MKKICLLLFVYITLSAIHAPQLSAQTNSGVIQEMTGTVEIKLPGAASFTEAKVGEPLSQDTVISTSFKSFAIIKIGSTLISVRPLTRLTLTEIQTSAETETLNVNLQSGRVKVDVKPPAGTKTTTSVGSPSATASVRGTSFEFDTRNLYVDNGTVSFTGKRGQEVRVGAGGSSRVEADDRAIPPAKIMLAGVLPPPPVGSDVAGIIATDPVRKGVVFIINLEFGN